MANEEVLWERGCCDEDYLRGSDSLERGANRFLSTRKAHRNAHAELFNSTFPQECLNAHWFMMLSEASEIIEAWSQEYNSRPHTALGERTPNEFAAQD